MRELVDLGPAAADMKRVLAGIGPAARTRPTPCAEFTVEDLLEHIAQAARTLTAAAQCRPGDSTDSYLRGRPITEMIAELTACVDQLAAAWRDPRLPSLETTTAGGVTMPVDFHNRIAVQELVLHAWDLAAATEQDFRPDPDTLDALRSFFIQVVADSPRDGSGPFGPAITVEDDAPVLDQVLAMSGRNPRWHPPE